MSEEINNTTRTLKSIINTPFKKIVFVFQVLSWVLIVASPVIGALIGKALVLNATKTGGVILGIFIAGEVLFYLTLAFLGKELIVILKEKFKTRFRRSKDSI